MSLLMMDFLPHYGIGHWDRPFVTEILFFLICCFATHEGKIPSLLLIPSSIAQS